MQLRLGRDRLSLTIVVLGLALLSLPLMASSARAACSMEGSQPDSGTLTLQYVKPSTRNSDRNDYRLSGTIRWNSPQALSCFDDGWVDWAYEHNLTYQKHFDRKIWSPDFSAFPAESGPYIDTTLSDFGNLTDHSFGLFRPERLSAGKTYSFSYSLFLPRNPPKDYHSFYLSGQVLEKQCSWGLNCVNLPGARSDGEPFIGKERRFEVTGTTCWAWQKKKSPTPCPTQAPPSTEPAAPSIPSTPTTPVSPAPEPSAPTPVEPPLPPSNPSQPTKPPTPSRTVTLSKGDSAQGLPGCVSSYCRFMVVTWKNFSSGAHSITCRASNGEEGGFYTYQRSGSSGTSAYCYYGFPGRTAWVTVDGVSSNRITW